MQMNRRSGRVEAYAIVGFLGLAAYALGLAAEITKVKEISRDSYGTCIYPRSPAAPFAYVAAFSTFIAVIIVSVATRCGCSRSSSDDDGDYLPRFVIVIFFIYMWIAASLSIFNLLLGALINQKLANTSSKCNKILSLGVFARGGFWALVSCAVGLFSYCFAPNNSRNAPVEPGIALGTPSYKP